MKIKSFYGIHSSGASFEEMDQENLGIKNIFFRKNKLT